jgi:hypothetical protein
MPDMLPGGHALRFSAGMSAYDYFHKRGGHLLVSPDNERFDPHPDYQADPALPWWLDREYYALRGSRLGALPPPEEKKDDDGDIVPAVDVPDDAPAAPAVPPRRRERVRAVGPLPTFYATPGGIARLRRVVRIERVGRATRSGGPTLRGVEIIYRRIVEQVQATYSAFRRRLGSIRRGLEPRGFRINVNIGYLGEEGREGWLSFGVPGVVGDGWGARPDLDDFREALRDTLSEALMRFVDEYGFEARYLDIWGTGIRFYGIKYSGAVVYAAMAAPRGACRVEKAETSSQKFPGFKVYYPKCEVGWCGPAAAQYFIKKVLNSIYKNNRDVKSLWISAKRMRTLLSDFFPTFLKTSSIDLSKIHRAAWAQTLWLACASSLASTSAFTTTVVFTGT